MHLGGDPSRGDEGRGSLATCGRVTGGVAVQELLLGEGRASDAHTSYGFGGLRGIRPYCIQLMLLLRGAKRRSAHK